MTMTTSQKENPGGATPGFSIDANTAQSFLLPRHNIAYAGSRVKIPKRLSYQITMYRNSEHCYD